MANILFTGEVLDEARRGLRSEPRVFGALVDIGGYHFECGIEEFFAWCAAVGETVTSEVSISIRKAILADSYFAMRNRAYELARRLVNSNAAPRPDVAKLLNRFMAIEKPKSEVPEAQVSQPARESKEKQVPSIAKRVNDPLGELLAELNSYIGLNRVKADISELANSIKVDRMRRDRGLQVAQRSNHMVFYGNPGTGKTTIAALVAKIYKVLGVVSKGQLVVTDRSGLVGEYVGHTAPKVRGVVEGALGGVLFIDEAYSLAPRESAADFGNEAIQQLLILMEEHRNDLVVIVAGYKDEMARFLDSNPGVSSRFARKLLFDDYSPEELVRIFEKMCTEKDYSLDEAARTKLFRLFQIAYSRRDRTFGNARLARNHFEKAIANLANRIVEQGCKDRLALMLIKEQDIPEPAEASDPSSQRPFFPDLGRYLAATFASGQKTMFIYPTFEMVNLAVLGPGQYCTTQNAVYEGREYCGTFDFGDDILDEILARTPAAVEQMVRSSLARDCASTRSLVFPEPVNIGIAAKLGKPQTGLHENFIPLVIMKVF